MPRSNRYTASQWAQWARDTVVELVEDPKARKVAMARLDDALTHTSVTSQEEAQKLVGQVLPGKYDTFEDPPPKKRSWF